MNECPAGLFEASPAERPCRNNGSGKWLEVLTQGIPPTTPTSGLRR